MTDVFDKNKRSAIMSQVKGSDTKPEMVVRSLVHSMGYRYRLHKKDLPGKPDLILPRHHKVIFVHGCFWHGHKQCKRSIRPSTNTDFWNAKLDRNIERDERFQRELVQMGWEVLVVWECQTRKPDELKHTLERFLCNGRQSPTAADGPGSYSA